MKLIQKVKLTGLILAGTLTGCDNSDADYIVRYNIDNKIVYSQLSDSTDMHVLEYSDSDKTRCYKDIMPGDTISGSSLILNEPIAYNPFLMEIRKVNGKNWTERQKIARRDSIIHDVQQKCR